MMRISILLSLQLLIVLEARAQPARAAISRLSQTVAMWPQTNRPPRLRLADLRAYSQRPLTPLEGAIIPLGSTNRVAAEIINAEGPVDSVEVLEDGIRRDVPDSFQPGFPHTYPYSLWIPDSLGKHRLQAVAVERSGNRLLSEELTVIVARVQAPSLTILSPTNTAHFPAGSVITVKAAASDATGRITNMWIGGAMGPICRTNGPAIELALTNWYDGWRQLTVTAVNDSAQKTEKSVMFFIAHEEDTITPPTPTAEADSPTSVRLTWKAPPVEGKRVSLVLEQRPTGGQ